MCHAPPTGPRARVKPDAHRVSAARGQALRDESSSRRLFGRPDICTTEVISYNDMRARLIGARGETRRRWPAARIGA
jgi:hypothetical protein